MSRGQHRSRHQSGSRILERCQSGNVKNTIVIDDDGNHADVVVLDDPCSYHPSQKSQECLHGDVIFIDVEEDNSSNLSGVGASNQSREMLSTSSLSKNLDSDVLVTKIVHGKVCHDNPGPSRNCYGLGHDSEYSMTESNSLKSDDHQCNDFEVSSSDCEIIEDFSGSIREQWEKAASRKKVNIHFASSDEDSTSDSFLSSTNIAGPSVNILTVDDNENLNLNSAFNTSLEQCDPNSDMLPEEPLVFQKDNKSNPGKCLQPQPKDGCLNALDKDEELKDKRERKVEVFYCSQQKPVIDHGVADITGRENRECKESPIISCQQEETMFSTETSNALLKISDLAQTSHTGTIEMLSNCISLIGGRERHKETDEYRRVAEEEWASRQKQLQFQAKEAQLLRKRRKAERIRLLDMEKRQKQRLEEIRYLQRKDVETTQIKEQIRTEVRKELDCMETKYKDMASILRAVGINVKGGFYPTLHEVNVACKQALIKFHPDRASRSDIRQQIEAEEKFKLISRLKEKLVDSTSFGCK